MKILKFAFVALAVALSSAAAWADRGHIHWGVSIGPVWGPWYYSPYYYPPQPIIIERPEPPVYIQQPPAPAPAPDVSAYWYYCAGAKAYYPYVKECPGGWQRVAPRPPDQP